MKPTLRYLLLLLFVLVGQPEALRAQSASGGNFPVPYGPTNVGTEFFLSFPANWDYAADFKYVRLYITSGVETTVRVYAGQTLVKTVRTIPMDIVTVDLTLLQAQIFTRNDFSPVPDDQIYRKKAVHIIADDPIVVYGINRITATSDGLLALPTNALGREYVVASARDITGGYQKLPSQYMIIAPYDGTTVTIFNSSETPNHKVGEPVTIRLDSGDVYSAMSAEGTGGDLSGTFISASRPIAVTAGQNCTYLPTAQYPACDHLCEMMLPIASWGKVYHSVPFANRTKGDLYRIFSGAPDAKIYINDIHIATLPAVGGDQGIGWLEYLPPDRKLLEFKSDKPIMIAQYNNSQTYDNATQTDPMYLVLSPVEQFQSDLVFSTPGQDYGDNYINLVADSATYQSIEIARGGVQNYDLLSRRYPTIVRNFTTRINGKTYVGVSFRIDPGTYHMRGSGPFAGYIYGFNNFDSYGYPLSAAVGDLDKLDSIPPEVTRQQDCFGSVRGTVTDLPFEDSVRTNLSTVYLDYRRSTNYRLTVDYFVPGESPSTRWRLAVIDPTKDARAIVIFSDKAGNATFDTVSFAAFSVTVDSTDIDFGTFFTGGSEVRNIRLRNLASKAVTITESTLRFGNVGFTILDPTGPFTLDSAGGPNDAKTFVIRFDATVAGDFLDSVAIRDECGLRNIAAVRANVGTPVISVTDRNFFKWPITAPAKPDVIYIRNISTDGGKLTVTGVQQDINDQVTFTLPNGKPAFPLQIAAGDQVELAVAFKPSAIRTYIDSIVFSHNAPPNPANDPTGILEGEGIQGTLIASSFNWGDRRVGSGPHAATITLTNVGTSTVTLRTPLVLGGDVGDFTIVDETVLNNLVLDPSEQVDLAVTFTPSVTGQRRMTITYPHDPQPLEPVTSTLEGFGTIPALVTNDYDFGSMDIAATSDNVRTIVFELPPPTVPDVIDSVTIVRWDFDPAGDPDFRADLPPTPLVLKRSNPSISFTGYFRAQQVGARRTRLTAVTADGVDATSVWTGTGLVDVREIAGTPVSFGVLCATDTTIEAVITNSKPLPVTITALQLSGLPASFSIDPMPTLPVTLDQGESLSVPITYRPSGAGVFDGFLVVTNNSDNAPNLQLRVQGASVEQTVPASVELTADGPGGRVELGRDFVAGISLGEPVTSAIAINKVRVAMTFDPERVEPRVNQIAPGEDYPTATVQIASIAPGGVVVEVTSPTGFASAGEIVTMPFGVYFNADLTRTIEATITTTDAECLRFATAPDSIEVVPICGLGVRLIELTNTTYALQQNSPNPFNPVTRINYSLGLDGRTTMVLHDAAGKLVQVLLDEQQQPGTYELTLDVTNLPSGMYYYTLSSGAWTATRTLTVTK